MGAKIYLDEEKIIDMYLNKKMSSNMIAKEFRCSPPLVTKVLKKNNVKFFKQGFFIIGKLSCRIKFLDGKELRKLYINENKNASEIGRLFNCSHITILNTLKRFNIPRKSMSESIRGKRLGENNSFYNRKHKKESIKKMSEFRKSQKGKIHHSEETKKKIGLGNKGKKVSNETRRRSSKTKKVLFAEGKIKAWNKNKTHLDDERILFGENIHLWRGGISCDPYDKKWTEAFRKLIRSRDKNICLKCGIKRKELNIELTVHHINYDKQATVKENCCAVCRRCNFQVNINREHWQKFFKSLLSEKYGYKYSETGEIILEISPISKR